MVGAVFGHTRFAQQLERAGHAVHQIDPLEDPGAIQHVDLVLLDGGGDGVAWAASKLAAHARPRQMFLHTALAHGPQLLDDVETSQAIVMCAHNLFGDVWVTAAADELGETVVGLLVNEVGGTNVPIGDGQRAGMVASQRMRALERTLRNDAYLQLTATLPAAELMQAEFMAAEAPEPEELEPAELERIFAAIEDPGVRRLFVDVERRRAEQMQSTDAELWAYAKYEGTL